MRKYILLGLGSLLLPGLVLSTHADSVVHAEGVEKPLHKHGKISGALVDIYGYSHVEDKDGNKDGKPLTEFSGEDSACADMTVRLLKKVIDIEPEFQTFVHSKGFKFEIDLNVMPNYAGPKFDTVKIDQTHMYIRVRYSEYMGCSELDARLSKRTEDSTLNLRVKDFLENDPTVQSHRLDHDISRADPRQATDPQKSIQEQATLVQPKTPEENASAGEKSTGF